MLHSCGTYRFFLFFENQNIVTARLVGHFKHTFKHFKHTYTLFYTFFHPHVYQKHSNNIITQTPLTNTLKVLNIVFFFSLKKKIVF